MSRMRDAFGLRPLAFGIVAALAAIGSPALAQQQPAGAPQPAASNPIVVQRIYDQFVVAPEYKLTDMNGRTGQLVGVTGGYLMQQTFLLGGAVYHLVDGPSDWHMTYGGFVLGVQMPPERTIRFGARGLLGWGQASNVDTFNAYPSDIPMPFDRGMGSISLHLGGVQVLPFPLPIPTRGRMHIEENFFVFEPQGDLVFAITDNVRFGASAGYRWTDSNDYFQHAINGVTGTFMLQVGFGK